MDNLDWACGADPIRTMIAPAIVVVVVDIVNDGPSNHIRYQADSPGDGVEDRHGVDDIGDDSQPSVYADPCRGPRVAVSSSGLRPPSNLSDMNSLRRQPMWVNRMVCNYGCQPLNCSRKMGCRENCTHYYWLVVFGLGLPRQHLPASPSAMVKN